MAKNVIITGSNGMIGQLVLAHCLEHPEIGKVTSLTRKPLGISHPKLVEVIHADFLELQPIAHHFRRQDICYYCLGVYTGAVPEPEFIRITVNMTRAFASLLKEQSDKANFNFLSGAGADRTEKSRMLFAKQKGIAENFLVQQRFDQLHIFRPGYIYPDTPRVEPNAMYRIMRRLYKPIAAIYPNIGVSSGVLARKMFEVGLQGSEQLIFENADIRK